jgi:hypothetical protein
VLDLIGLDGAALRNDVFGDLAEPWNVPLPVRPGSKSSRPLVFRGVTGKGPVERAARGNDAQVRVEHQKGAPVWRRRWPQPSHAHARCWRKDCVWPQPVLFNCGQDSIRPDGGPELSCRDATPSHSVSTLAWNLSSRRGFSIQRIGPCPSFRGLPTPAAVSYGA